MVDEVRNQIHLIKIEDLTPAQIESAAGGVYLSKNELNNQNDTQNIVNSFRSVKVPTLGTLIPQTTAIHSIAGTGGEGTIFVPLANKSYILLAGDCVNGGAAPLTAVLMLHSAGKSVALETQLVGPSETVPFSQVHGVAFDSTTYPYFKVTTGTAGDATFSVAVGETVQ